MKWPLPSLSNWKIRRLASVMFLFSLLILETCRGAVERVPLGTLLADSAKQGWGTLEVNRSVWGKPLQIGDRKFAEGLGTHANSEIVYELEHPCERFESWVGVDAAVASLPGGSVIFQVFGDERELFNSGVMRAATAARKVSVSLTSVQRLRLVVTDAGDGRASDHADWAEPVLVRQSVRPAASTKAKFKVTSPGLTLWLTEEGKLARIRAGALEEELLGSTRLSGCSEKSSRVTRLPGGAIEFASSGQDAQQHAFREIQRFTPTSNSICWTIEITGEGEPWTTPIKTELKCSAPEKKRIWFGWSDPDHEGEVWHDPLMVRPFVNRSWHYGNAAQNAPVGGDFISLPLVSIFAPDENAGFSLVLSPEDVLLDVDAMTSTAGEVRFTRSCHRLGAGKTVRLTMDLVAHEASWRGGLRWLAARYAAFFQPPNPKADALAGCGAYSGDEQPVDVEKFNQMAFRINWKLSDDFPYMGMFIPPVKDADERWLRSCGEPAPPGKTPTISCREMNDYGRWMRQNGFHVLNYFNVTEFGKNMKDAEISPAQINDPDLWKDPVAFVKLRLPHAYFKQQPPHMYYGAWLMDIGDSEYRQFMLEQARRHIELLPDTDGICIDRMDWLRCYNPDGDDGVSWVNGKPARSLYQSWNGFMAQLGPLMHRADKVIFGNTMTMRLELNRELDGIYTEHGNNPGALNAAALMGIHKPVLGWTLNKTLQEPNPDAFFQRHLYLGVYPTAPYPWNHHCITPEPQAERYYMDYGPLMKAMGGKKWVLEKDCVQAETAGVKVNLFQVPGGYALPVVFGGQNAFAQIRVDVPENKKSFIFECLHPGSLNPVPLHPEIKNGVCRLRVPLERGCAMVRLISVNSASGYSGDKTK